MRAGFREHCGMTLDFPDQAQRWMMLQGQLFQLLADAWCLFLVRYRLNASRRNLLFLLLFRSLLLLVLYVHEEMMVLIRNGHSRLPSDVLEHLGGFGLFRGTTFCIFHMLFFFFFIILIWITFIRVAQLADVFDHDFLLVFLFCYRWHLFIILTTLIAATIWWRRLRCIRKITAAATATTFNNWAGLFLALFSLLFSRFFCCLLRFFFFGLGLGFGLLLFHILLLLFTRQVNWCKRGYWITKRTIDFTNSFPFWRFICFFNSLSRLCSLRLRHFRWFLDFWFFNLLLFGFYFLRFCIFLCFGLFNFWFLDLRLFGLFLLRFRLLGCFRLVS